MKPKTLPFTGERFTPETRGLIALEHLHRYLFAKQLTNKKTVLDIACGEGYGSEILSKNAKHVIGVDISEEAIAHARSTYNLSNLEYKQGSCSKIPVSDDTVDVVVSFETLEHHDEHEEMFREIKRVLKPDGILILSSPDKFEHSDKTGYVSPWHVKELYRTEFENLLSRYFSYHTLLGQRVVYGSFLVSDSRSYNIETFNFNNYSEGPRRGLAVPLFLIGLASDREIPEITQGILEQNLEDTDHQKQIDSLTEWATSAETYGKSLREALDRAQEAYAAESTVRERERAEVQKQIDSLTEWATSAETYGKSLREALDRAQEAYAAESTARECERAEAQKQIDSLTEWATSAETYGKSLREALDRVQEAYAAESAARASERAETEKQIAVLNRIKSSWLLKLFLRYIYKEKSMNHG